MRKNIWKITAFIPWLILGVIIVGVPYLGVDLRNERIRADRGAELNLAITNKLKSASARIVELEQFYELDRRTIASLERDKQRLNAANHELARLAGEQREIIDRIAAGDGVDQELLDRLREIIEELPARNKPP